MFYFLIYDTRVLVKVFGFVSIELSSSFFPRSALSFSETFTLFFVFLNFSFH